MSYPQSKITNKFLKDLLKSASTDIVKSSGESHIDIDHIWTLVVGEKIAALSEVKSFNQGILVIKVSSASLNHLLATSEKPKILAKLKTNFSFLKVKSLIFKSG